jgi:hypothetical protein
MHALRVGLLALALALASTATAACGLANKCEPTGAFVAAFDEPNLSEQGATPLTEDDEITRIPGKPSDGDWIKVQYTKADGQSRVGYVRADKISC